ASAEKSTGRRLFDAVTAGGASVAGRNTGAIAVGKLADLMALDAQSVDLAGRSGDTLLDCFVFAGDDRMISDVWSAGRHMVSEGRHIGREAIVQKYVRTMKDLREAI
ncbi:MAG: amidohydrolase family protein, partial [Hoeflea sp.]|nr:amidohydrolase family protein [Hoeflea sp.]